MQSRVIALVLAWFCGSAPMILAALTAEQIRQLPPAASQPVSFNDEIRPLLERSCTKCHGKGKAKGDFRIDTRETLLKGGGSGPAVVPGKSGESYLIELVSGLDEDNVMPQKGSRLTPAQIGLLRAWIDQGLPWDANVTFAKPDPVNLRVRRPELPPAAGRQAHPIDRWLDSYWPAHGIKPAKAIDDRVYARRVYLDVIGLLPEPEELDAFLSDGRADKRQRLVRRLLEDRQRYAEHWLSFWNDLLRNDYRGTGFIDSGRKQITPWLFAALAGNMPFDKFVAQLINPVEGSEGFTKGIVWRGVVNASQVPELQAAQNISQIFLGVNLKCASCHDSFINDWTLADAYGLANVYAEKTLELFECDKATGQKAVTRFLFPELGEIDQEAKKSDRIKRLAEIITSRENGRLTRTLVNRLWARFMGRGLVEPVDDLEQAAWHPDLLDWLAEDLADQQYDLKRTIELILTSQAYQLPAVSLEELPRKDYVFAGPAVRRLSAEQYLDAIATLTGLWKTLPANTEIDFTTADPELRRDAVPARAHWVWNQESAPQAAPPMTIYFRTTTHFPEKPTEALAVVTCDNAFTLYINGKEVASSKEWQKPKLVDIQSHLVKGENLFAIAAVNDPPEDKDKDKDKDKDGDKGRSEDQGKKEKKAVDNPAGLWFYARVRHQRHEDGVPIERIWDFGSDRSWQCTGAKFADWNRPGFEPEGWIAAVEVGDLNHTPWQLENKLVAALSSAAQYRQVRMSLVASDPLMTALGRPTREQVITSRPAAATTLQALELTNGSTLADLLRRGSERLAAGDSPAPDVLVTALFRQGLGRKPTAAELGLSRELLGEPVKREGIEDFLWTLTLLPEFQLIY